MDLGGIGTGTGPIGFIRFYGYFSADFWHNMLGYGEKSTSFSYMVRYPLIVIFISKNWGSRHKPHLDLKKNMETFTTIRWTTGIFPGANTGTRCQGWSLLGQFAGNSYDMIFFRDAVVIPLHFCWDFLGSQHGDDEKSRFLSLLSRWCLKHWKQTISHGFPTFKHGEKPWETIG